MTRRPKREFIPGILYAMADMNRPADGGPKFLSLPPMRYPRAYVWLIFISAIDIICTWIILVKHEGNEANPIVAWVIENFGSTGMIVFKFSLMIFVIVICEIVGRKKDRTGMRLAWTGVAISALPLMVSVMLVLERIKSFLTLSE
ncbi:MAG: DUF5658 family protein [Planctomycetota bacterium]|nr:DUF5658 family protein [Planctomycetota bacterium]